MNQHASDFGIQGKRLLHIESLNGKKLYIGVKALNYTEKLGKSIAASLFGGRGHSATQRQYAPAASIAQNENNLTTFEISATYIPSNKPDILDRYQLQNASYGIQVLSTKGNGPRREITISWSPVMA